jgi:hypothetical protein
MKGFQIGEMVIVGDDDFTKNWIGETKGVWKNCSGRRFAVTSIVSDRGVPTVSSDGFLYLTMAGVFPRQCLKKIEGA